MQTRGTSRWAFESRCRNSSMFSRRSAVESSRIGSCTLQLLNVLKLLNPSLCLVHSDAQVSRIRTTRYCSNRSTRLEFKAFKNTRPSRHSRVRAYRLLFEAIRIFRHACIFETVRSPGNTSLSGTRCVVGAVESYRARFARRRYLITRVKSAPRLLRPGSQHTGSAEEEETRFSPRDTVTSSRISRNAAADRASISPL